MPDAQFYLGRWADDQQPVAYDPADLTTHAVLIGMTGSGKTGLLIALLEEAARQSLPAIIIDPKGDLTNLLLHFPELRPADFAPWVDPEQARRANLSLDELAAATAERWRKGLSDWDLGEPELAALREQVDYTIYTPGSTAGVPVNLLSSFEAPAARDGASAALQEADRERIAATVTALLGLIGLQDVDPLRSREHILLSNILEANWSRGVSLDLPGLIEQVTNPPFDRLGAFPLERFFSEKERFELALLLNNFLAAPSFQTWLEGQPLDVARLLRSPADRPRFSIFYLAHLSENERMFFVTLLLAAVEGWMRGQRGTSGLRALLAFDEITGYLPPVANPPSRPVLLRLLKQARAFGLGLALATQNPSDLNYKALSNAGTWFIGRLQTEQDKQRLLDGLQALDSAIDRSAFDRLIAGLKPRLFLMHNVHNPSPRVFQSRWVLNYLAGPLTRVQLPALKPLEAVPAEAETAAGSAEATSAEAQPAEAQPAEVQPARPAPRAFNAEIPAASSPLPDLAPRPAARPSSPPLPARSVEPLSANPPAVPANTAVYFWPVGLSQQRALSAQGGALRGPLEPRGLLYKSALLAQGAAHTRSPRYNLDYTRTLACLAPDPQPNPDWAAFSRPPFDLSAFGAPDPTARFQDLPSILSTASGLATLKKDFLDWLYRAGTVDILANETLKVYAGPDQPQERFRRQLAAVAQEGLQAESEKIAEGYDRKLEALKRKIERQQLVVDRRADMLNKRKAEQTSNDLELFASVFSRRKRSLTTSMTKRRMTQQAQGELDEAKKVLSDLQSEWKALVAERQSALQRAQAEWAERAAQVRQLTVSPLKKDLLLDQFGVAWLPYYRFQGPDGMVDLPAF